MPEKQGYFMFGICADTTGRGFSILQLWVVHHKPRFNLSSSCSVALNGVPDGEERNAQRNNREKITNLAQHGRFGWCSDPDLVAGTKPHFA